MSPFPFTGANIRDPYMDAAMKEAMAQKDSRVGNISETVCLRNQLDMLEQHVMRTGTTLNQLESLYGSLAGQYPQAGDVSSGMKEPNGMLDRFNQLNQVLDTNLTRIAGIIERLAGVL